MTAMKLLDNLHEDPTWRDPIQAARAGNLNSLPALPERGPMIRFAVLDSPVGRVMVAATERGVCALFLGDTDAELEAELRAEFPDARILQDSSGLGEWGDGIRACLEGRVLRVGITLDARGTPFQRRVWDHLRTIPAGQTRTYTEVAEALGLPRGTRAVGRACATNPVSVIVACHRVVRGDGSLAGYRWGIARKRALLERERRQVEADSSSGV
jgi:AraC family transcriptional regulator, regulatory protein of adaptative response / methylated-DNA-[protein]-cysteine methyltransferase